MLEAHGIFFGDGLLPTCADAFVAPADKLARWSSQAERLVGTMEQLATELVDDAPFCDSLGLDPEALALLRTDHGYSRTCVLCRPDGIPIGNDVKLVELNSDSPAMMMFLDIVAKCLLELPVFEQLRGNVQLPRAADHLLDALLECHREHPCYRGVAPRIAIADWEGQKTRFEHKRLAEHFRAHGNETVVCDPRALELVDGELRFEGQRIDLIYRRALSAEILEHRHEVAPLLRAYRDGLVCMVNPLRSYLVGTKSVLSRPEVLATTDVPRTLVLNSELAREMVISSQSRWALKRSQGHGGDGVVLPEPENEAAWAAAIRASRHEVWIAQEYLQVPRVTLRVVEHGAVREVDKFFNWNPFIFGGRYAGSIVRVSDSPLINITLGGGLLPTFTG